MPVGPQPSIHSLEGGRSSPRDIGTLEDAVKAGSDSGTYIYSATKFIQLLGAQWWRRQLHGTCQVVAVSPGLIPGTNLSRYGGMKMDMSMPDAKPVPEGMNDHAPRPAYHFHAPFSCLGEEFAMSRLID